MDPNALVNYLLDHFRTRDELSGFLQLHVWPRMAERRRTERENVKAAHTGRPVGRPSPTNERFCDLTGAELTDREVVRRSESGDVVREITTGKVMRYRRLMVGRRVSGIWEEVPNHGAAWKTT